MGVVGYVCPAFGVGDLEAIGFGLGGIGMRGVAHVGASSDGKRLVVDMAGMHAGCTGCTG